VSGRSGGQAGPGPAPDTPATPAAAGGPQVIGLGMCTVDMLFVVPEIPAFGHGLLATAYLRQGGGPVATALVALARLGVSTALIGSVGDDDDGAFIVAELEREGVNVDRLRRVAGARSRVALVLVQRHTGERGFAGCPETCPPLGPGHLLPEELAGARILHLDDATPGAVQAARWARAGGAEVVFDGTWTSDYLEELLPLVDVAIVSEPFARAWAPASQPAALVERLRGYGARVAVLTRGSRGCVVSDASGVRAYAAYPVAVVDTTGAGDAFHGGFIYGLLQGWDTPHVVRFASAVAALNCRQLGGRTALPRLDEVARFLACRPPLADAPVA